MLNRLLLTLLLALLTGFSGVVFAQTSMDPNYNPSDERSAFEERRKSILDANTLRATYHNYGFGGRTGEDNRDELYFEYPKNTNRRYLYFVSIFTGAEVRNQINDEPIPVVIAPNYRTNPQTGDSWAKNPVFGYYNENSEELARSDMGPGSASGNTWPSFWPDKMDDTNDPGWPDQWNGFFGKDIFNADQEFYYRSGDDLYTRFSQDGRWLPDPEDPSRGGLGLVMDARMLAWTQNLISSVHFNIFEVRNDSKFNYEKMSFMLWTADWIGTPENDRPFFDQQRSIAFYEDTMPTQSPSEFDGTSIGVAGIRFLETPGNAVDGIDNDGDSDLYNPFSSLGIYDASNADLYSPLIVANGGFIQTQDIVQNEVLPLFTDDDFVERQLSPGDPLVLIADNGDRILMRYPPNEAFGDSETMTIRSQGRDRVIMRGGMTVREDTLQARHLNLIDDDFDGLIDENQPNHLSLSTFRGGVVEERPVRYINYRWEGFYEGHAGYSGISGWNQVGEDNTPEFIVDSDFAPEFQVIQRGLFIPDSWIEQRMDEDDDFRAMIEDYQDALVDLYVTQPSSPVFPEDHFDRYFFTFHTAAPMIDESREDFWDNNRDWLASDDVGVDGVEGTGSPGEGSGFPSSGAFTPFPGEPNIDDTDVREADRIGISSATFISAGGLGGGRNFRGDNQIWRDHMVPGLFALTPDPQQDTDQFITSSFFPLNAGSTERFAVAITVAQTGTPTNDADIELVTQQLEQAFNAFDANYQFAIAPPPPRLTAVPGNGRVTLYWDAEAEEVFDRYLDRIGANPRNFEGYRVYRSTDPALIDATIITDGRGNRQFLQPIAQFDLINGIVGNHPVDINGLEFYLGSDTGLQRYFVDTDVINGREYYYVVTAYNSGAAIAGIAPSESPINISINPDGSLTAGQNVKKVFPTNQSAGYVGPGELVVDRLSGNATGDVFADIIDPRDLSPESRYRLTFESEEVTENGVTWNRTRSFTLVDLTNDRVIFEDREDINGTDVPVFDGVRLSILNDNFTPDQQRSNLRLKEWTSDREELNATIRAQRVEGSSRNYKIVFDSSPENRTRTESTVLRRGAISQQVRSQEVPFRVLDADTGEDVPFAFMPSANISASGRGNGIMSGYYDNQTRRTHSDIIYIKEHDRGGELQVAWQINLEPYNSREVYSVQDGDVLLLNQSTEFTEDDVFEFVVDPDLHLPREDAELANEQMKNIRVVPNPYIVTHLAEPRPTAANPTQLRQLHFTNLPAQCTIRIFTVSGRLVQTLNVNNSIDNDRYIWDMLTKDNLELAYGVYIYHVEAPGIGEKTGKFAVIK